MRPSTEHPIPLNAKLGSGITPNNLYDGSRSALGFSQSSGDPTFGL